MDRINFDITEDEGFWYTNVHLDSFGIPNVVVWFGPNPDISEILIIVCNNPLVSIVRDCFAVYLPAWRLDGFVNKEILTEEVLEDLKKWIFQNFETIILHIQGDIDSAELFRLLRPLSRIH